MIVTKHDPSVTFNSVAKHQNSVSTLVQECIDTDRIDVIAENLDFINHITKQMSLCAFMNSLSFKSQADYDKVFSILKG